MNREIPIVLVSVDPGASSGWVFWRSGELEERGLFQGDNIHAIYRLIGGLHKREPRGKRVLVIEDQYIGNNMKTSKTLIMRRSRWQAIAELFGWDIVLLNPRSWQAASFRGMLGKDTKKKSIIIATQIMKEEPKSIDIADAVCMGQFWLDSLQRPIKPKKQKQKNKVKKRSRNV